MDDITRRDQSEGALRVETLITAMPRNDIRRAQIANEGVKLG